MPKRKCIFNSELQRLYPSFKPSKTPWQVQCSICGNSLSISNKGKGDIEEHISSKKHQHNLKSVANTSNVLENMVRMTDDIRLVRAAEITMCYHTLSHHQSFNSLDCTVPLDKKMYPDSDICKKVTCARTKARAVVSNVLGPLSLKLLLQDLERIQFIGVSTDSSNHLAMKIFPVLLQYFDYKKGGTTSKILDISFEKNEKSDTISDMLVNTLQKSNLLSKCIAFCGDNCNTNFGGQNRKGTNNVFARLKCSLNQNLVGVGCPAHILNNAIHHGCDALAVDVEVIVLKIFNHFSIFTVKTELLKDFCDFVDVEYKQLLYHTKTRWLSLFPAVDRILWMYEPLKSFFLSNENPPKILESFFKNEFSEAYLFLVHSLMSVFHSKVQRIEREDNSIIEVMFIIKSISDQLNERIQNNFVPLKIREILKKNRENGLENESNEFYSAIQNFYKVINQYLQLWLEPLKEFDVFEWMNFKTLESEKWESVEPCLAYLQNKGVLIDDNKFFNQWCNLKQFYKMLNDKDKEEQTHICWTKYFNQCTSEEMYSELLKLAQFFFSIIAHNANVERVFSLIESQWTKERNKLLPKTVKSIILAKYNFKDMNCQEFHNFILKDNNRNILSDVGNNNKYNYNNKDE